MTNQQVLSLLLPPPTPSGLPSMQPFQLDPYGSFSQQWVTYEQARAFVKFWNTSVAGMQILPGDDGPLTNPVTGPEQPAITEPPNGYGIYKPFAVQTYFPESKKGPDGVTYYWLAARFLDVQAKAVRAGLDIGLMIAQFYRYPYSSGLVISDLVTQVQSMPATPYQV